MKINVFTKNIEVEPNICKDSKDKFKIILRCPNQYDATKILLANELSDRVPLICDLFIKFENKPILVDEEGKEIKYETLKDMLNFGGNEIYLIIMDVFDKVLKTINKGTKVEKKS